MASGFDPYYKWLGIPPEEQPPNHYRLLGLRLFESDPEVIEAASDQRMAHLRTYQTGQYSAFSQKLLNEVAAARVCLLSQERRARYDAALRAAAQRLRRSCLMRRQSARRLPISSAVPAIDDRGFDLERLGVSDQAGGQTADRPASGIGRWNKLTSHDGAAATGPRNRLLIALLAALAILLSGITAAVMIIKAKRAEEAKAAAGNSFDPAKPGDDTKPGLSAAELAADLAAAQLQAANKDLKALNDHMRELSIAVPPSPMHGTRLEPVLWLHMNFECDTTVEHNKMLFVKDLSGKSHHGICRQGRLVAGRAGNVLECDTPLRLLAGAVDQVPKYTILAWVCAPKSPKPADAAWWLDEDLAGKSLFAVGSGDDLQYRALSLKNKTTCDAIQVSKLATPPDQWNFIAVRGDVHSGDSFVTFQVNDQQETIKNPDLFPICAAGTSHTFFATTPKIQLDELMIFHAALSDADIQALRSNANPVRSRKHCQSHWCAA